MAELQKRYGQAELETADVIVALGGDGFMLRTLHRFLPAGLPVYGMKIGDVGFLMNRFREDELLERLNEADVVELNPLCMIAVTEAGNEATALAINEVALLRQLNQAAHIRILVNGKVKGRGPGVRRRAGRDCRRQHRLQPVGAWTDSAAGHRGAGADADIAVSSAALARRRAAIQCRGFASKSSITTSGRSAPRPTPRRSATWSVSMCSRKRTSR